MSKTEKYINQAKEMAGIQTSRPYGKALLITGGVVLAVWAARKVPWKKLVDPATLESVKETFASVTERLEDMAREYVNGPVAEAVGNTKKAAARIASATSESTTSAH